MASELTTNANEQLDLCCWTQALEGKAHPSGVRQLPSGQHIIDVFPTGCAIFLRGSYVLGDTILLLMADRLNSGCRRGVQCCANRSDLSPVLQA